MKETLGHARTPATGLAFLALLAATAGGAAGETEAPLPEIVLQNVSIQPLPESVRYVYVGPDQRAWFVLKWAAQLPTPEAIRKNIESEFAKPAPVLVGATPTLFEPGGRVWFKPIKSESLFGYDGKTWIERKAEKDGLFLGNCPNHGRQYQFHATNQYVAGNAFFPESYGIHCFDGRNWSFQPFPAPKGKFSRLPELRPEPDGKGLLAMLPKENGGSNWWRWRNGSWSQVDTAGLGKDVSVALFPATEDSALAWVMRYGRGRVNLLPYGAAPTAEVTRLIEQLGTGDKDSRDRAAQGLIRMGAAVRSPVEKALVDAGSQDLRWRLQWVLAEVKTAQNEEPTAWKVRFAPYELVESYPRLYDGGTIFATVVRASRDGKEVGPGLLIVDPAGRPAFMAWEGINETWPEVETGGPLVCRAGKWLWLPARRSPSGKQYRPATLLDVEARSIVATLETEQFGRIHAVKEDGTAFLSKNEHAAIAVFRPPAPGASGDSAELQAVHRVLLGEKSNGTFCVASDGAIWGEDAEEGLFRYDGKRFGRIAELERRNRDLRLAVPGRDGAVFAHIGQRATLLKPGQVCVAEDFKGLVEAYRDQVSAAAAGGVRGIAADGIQLVICPAGGGPGIWLARQGEARLYLDGRWKSASEADPRNSAFREAVAIPAGRSGCLYHARGDTFSGTAPAAYVEVKDGAISVSSAPAAESIPWLRKAVRDAQGRLWIPSATSRQQGGVTYTENRCTLCLDGGKTVLSVPEVGWPTLCDRAGNVWLSRGAMFFERRSEFAVCRDGKVVQSLSIPGADKDSLLVAGPAGTVYASCSYGVHQLVTSDPEKAPRYEVKKTWRLASLKGRLQALAHSDLGLLIALTAEGEGPDGRPRYYLNLFPAPESKGG